MKHYKNIVRAVLLLCLITPLITSCSDDTGAPPVLERVSLIAKDSTTNEGDRGTSYVIFGNNLATTQEVYFNDQLASLNTTYVRNDNIIIQIPSNAPYFDVSNKLRVVTKYGTAEMDFVVAQPKPEIYSFPGVAEDGSVIIITGNYFDGATVAFVDQSTEVAVQAEIVSATTGELQVVVPAGTKVSYIDVTTAAGTTRAASGFGFNYIVYSDKQNLEFDDWSWGGAQDYSSTTHTKSGEYSFKRTYTDAWSGIQLHNQNSLSLAGFKAFKMSIYGGPGTGTKKINVNLNWGSSVSITITEGVWTDYTFKLSDLGSPTNLDFIVLQDNGNTSPGQYVIWLDEIGFL